MPVPSYRKSTPTFTYTNPHPKGIRTLGDCVFRAIALATGKTWLEVYDDLVALGREQLAPPTDKVTYATYLDRRADRIDVMKGGKRLTPSDLAKRKDGKTYVVRVAGHLATVQGGKVRDTWDCGAKSAYVIWVLR